MIVPPFFENFGKRLIKSPKIYIADSGLACHLLRIDSAAELEKSPFHGVFFERFMAAEIVKAQINWADDENFTIFTMSRDLKSTS